MSSISPQEIKQEFLKSKIGIAGITILTILVLTSIVAIITIPVETFQEWNNPSNWISYPKVAIPVWGKSLYDRKDPRAQNFSDTKHSNKFTRRDFTDITSVWNEF